MKKAIVLFKNGFETIEALTVIDVFKRANVPCLMVGMDSLEVISSHNIKVSMDQLFDESIKDADLVILPGGMPGATNLQSDIRVIKLLQEFNNSSKLIASICAGPISLETAGIINGKKFTCYPGFEKQITSGLYQDELICIDGNIITARGPAASLQFAYTLLEQFGIDSMQIQDAMQYTYLLNKNKGE